MQYIGEHIIPGLIGKIFVWTSFAFAIISMVLYFLNLRKESADRFRRPGRWFFILHAMSLLAVAGILYYLIFNHYFEYSYVWQYSSKDLPFKYILSCFWAGQEGSFLVWALAQAVIGVVLIYRSRDWENHVMAIVALSQVFVASMLLGIHFGGIKIGGSPFTLIRETIPSIQGTVFEMPDYLTQITDGNGLNPLLENIWMTIHPPILFIGYALTVVPFAYAIASFFRKSYYSWIKPALPWTILSLIMLGAGILLGGAWAYVSLTFGGFWSWDPVENSSLVPWMTLVAALHFLLISRKEHNALAMAYLFIGLSYVLVLYASFLTRSGVLAETSAHSFGDNGMTVQLLVYLMVFLVLLVVFFAKNLKKFYRKRRENLLSREFWMFVGAVIIILSAFQIIFTTSIPVLNKLFGSNFAPPSDRVGFYNKWQMPYALLIAGFIAFTQFLNYNANSTGEFLRKMAIPALAAVVVVVPFMIFGLITEYNAILMLLFVFFAIFGSLYNLIFRTAHPRNVPAIVTHTGFAVFLLGTLLTFSNSEVISKNTSAYDLGDEKQNAENLLVMRNDTVYMKGFYLTYSYNTKKGNTTEYRLDFLERQPGKFVRKFTLYPSVNRHPRMGDVYNPDTKHFLGRDYYTYIATVGHEKDYIVIRAIMNPYINVLWAGALIMLGGFAYSFWRRARIRRIVSNT
jgi:cytochrome c-type biogenesis protein CcmF